MNPAVVDSALCTKNLFMVPIVHMAATAHNGDRGDPITAVPAAAVAAAAG